MESETTSRKIPSTLQACSFFSNLFLEFCFLTLGNDPAFSCIVLFHKFIQASDTLKFQSISLEPEILKVQVHLAEYFASTFSLVIPFSHDEHTKLMIPHLLSTYRWQFSTRNRFQWEGLNQSEGDPDSSSSDYFTLCPPRPVSFA